MNTSVIIAVVILYEIVSIGGCALYLKMKERKNKGGQAAAGDISTDHDIAWNRAMGTKTESCHHAGIIWKNVWSENPVICVCGNSTSDICYSYDRNAGAWNCV